MKKILEYILLIINYEKELGNNCVEFKKESVYNNIKRLKVSTPIILLLSLALLSIDYYKYTQGIWPKNSAYEFLFLMHLSGMIILLVLFLLLVFIKTESVETINRVHKKLVLLCSLMGVAILIGLTSAQLVINHSAAVFTGGIFAINAIIFMGNRISISVLLLAESVMSFIIFRLQYLTGYDYLAEIGYIHIYGLLSFILNRGFFLDHVKDFQNKKTIEKQNLILQEQAMHDPLTGILNRRSFIETAQKEIDRSHRYGRILSLGLLDIDHFKRINDKYGHIAGDIVLKEMTELISRHIRTNDFFARWGGEEFILLSPETQINEMMINTEKLRSLLEKKEYADLPVITSSFGISEYKDGESLEHLINRADNALYKAKAEGRNCIRIAE